MKPLALHPQNPHYFIYDGKPTILITSGEHYGAVLNLDFDYVTYLDELAKNGLNMTRTFTGVYIEPVGAFKMVGNTLAPLPQRFICPWMRSETPGFAIGGNKFDLTKFDEKYFARLKDFVKEAEKRKIIVELALFCPFYEDIQWNLSPMNAKNNINSVGPADRSHVYTLDKSEGLLAVHETLVRRIIDELKDYSNLIYEVANEPYWGVSKEWHNHMTSLIHDAEKDFQNRHLISHNIANGKQQIVDPHPAISVFNFHYAYPPDAVAQNYHFNKPIGDNETGFLGTADSTYRREGWAFILAGGASFNNLDYSFTAEQEDGSFGLTPTQPGGGSPTLRKQLGYLKNFMDKFDYLKMKPDSTLVDTPVTVKRIQVLAEKGRQYAMYIFGNGPVELDVNIPKGTYALEFLDPTTGTYTAKQNIVSDGTAKIISPAFTEDLAVRLVAENAAL